MGKNATRYFISMAVIVGKLEDLVVTNGPSSFSSFWFLMKYDVLESAYLNSTSLSPLPSSSPIFSVTLLYQFPSLIFIKIYSYTFICSFHYLLLLSYMKF